MFSIHFLNVGHGDCIVIELPQRNMIIDINNGQALDKDTRKELMEAYSITENELLLKSLDKVLFEKGYNVKLTNPIEYINSLGIRSFFRFVLSHPHMDHMTGLNDLINKDDILIENFWHSGVEVDTPDFSKKMYHKEDWNTYLKLKVSLENPKNLVKEAGDEGNYWTPDGIEILCPTSSLKSAAIEKNKINLCSYVFLLTYKGYKFVLAGDAEKESWDYIIEAYPEKIKNINVLKAAHHGRESGFHEDAVKLMNPEYTIVSVGKKPDTDAHNKYKKYTRQKVLSTRYRGNILVNINSNGASINWQYNKD